eukprot:2729646-Amphidinium_carterae.2
MSRLRRLPRIYRSCSGDEVDVFVAQCYVTFSSGLLIRSMFLPAQISKRWNCTVYVDDLLAVGHKDLLHAFFTCMQKTWEIATPEYLGNPADVEPT